MTTANVIPVNISANVGVSGGSPNDVETTAQYLTQLQQSLNGFTGSTAAALNYLLSVSAATPAQKSLVQVFLAAAYNPLVSPNTSGYKVLGLADNAGAERPGLAAGTANAIITPAVTGRVAVIASIAWEATIDGTVNAILEYGVGSTGPAQGTAAPVGTQIGLGSEVTFTSLSMSALVHLIPMALLTGLSKTTTYWFDVGISISTIAWQSTAVIAGPASWLVLAEV